MNLDLIERPTFEPHLGLAGSVSTVVLGGARDNDFVVMQVLAAEPVDVCLTHCDRNIRAKTLRMRQQTVDREEYSSWWMRASPPQRRWINRPCCSGYALRVGSLEATAQTTTQNCWATSVSCLHLISLQIVLLAARLRDSTSATELIPVPKWLSRSMKTAANMVSI